MNERDDDEFDAEDLADEPAGEQPAHTTVDDGSIELEPFRTEADAPRPRTRYVPTKAEASKRPTNGEMAIRVATVAAMIVNGFKRHDIHAYINEKLLLKWDGISERGIDRLIEKANKAIKSEAVVDVALEKGKATSRLDKLYRDCLNAKLLGTALRVQNRINKMHGLDAPLNIRHGSDPANPLPTPIGGGNFIVVVQEVEEG